MSVWSISNTLPGDDDGIKRKRKRLALSCTECQSRKIKCDRKVPNCSSCLARGIQRHCRWGDERDVEEKPNVVKRSISPDGDVDKVVEKVLKRLQGKASIASPSITSDSSTAYTPSNPIHSAANIIKTAAFVPNKFSPLDGRFSWPKQKEYSIDIERVRTSLKALPTRASVETLLDLYLSEVEPHRCAFNHVILQQQMTQFWQCIDELDIQGQFLVWPNQSQAAYSETLFSAKHEDFKSSESASHFLTGMVQQGLIALVFSLIYATLSSLHYERKIKMGIFPSTFTERDVEEWSEQFHQLSRLHLNLSDHIERPTLWTIQTLFLQTVYHMDHRSIRTSQINMSVILRLCVSLGLNRLGSAKDDARAILEENLRAKAINNTTTTDQEEDGRGNVTSKSFGVTISSFEEGNLAYRELGRKLWTLMVGADFTMGAHMDSYFNVHDNINHTCPPNALDDEEILSSAAPSLLLSTTIKTEPSLNAFPGCSLAIARAGRLQVELENTKGSPLPYEDILRIDQEFQKAIKSFPHFYHYRLFKVEGGSKQIAIQRIALHEQSQFRLLRLHRLHMGKGFLDEQYLPSLNACFHASKVIIDARIVLEMMVTHSRKMIGFQIHLLHAALVVHLILMFEMGQREEEIQNGRKRSKGIYKLENVDETVDQLQVALDSLRSTSSSAKDWPKGLDKLEAFLNRIKHEKSIQCDKSKSLTTQRQKHHHQQQHPIASSHPQSPRLAAADILASIPSSALTTPSTISNSSSISTNTLYDPTLTFDDQSLWSNDLWSLNALFPDYATNSIDLVDALERVIWS